MACEVLNKTTDWALLIAKEAKRQSKELENIFREDDPGTAVSEDEIRLKEIVREAVREELKLFFMEREIEKQMGIMKLNESILNGGK